MGRTKAHLESVEPDRSIRVVLAARDRRFVHVTSFLLGRKGFLIESVRTTEHLLEVVETHRPEVVILDGTDSLTVTARAIAAIEALPYHVAVLVVAEAPEVSSPKSVRLLHKWTSFDRLLDEVERLSENADGPEEVSHGVS
jgi:DNA-binding NtrC family response regulator